MAQTIDEAVVRKVAKLSRLNLRDEEVAAFAGQLDRILHYVEQLEAVDVAGIEPMAHPLPVTNVLRADEPRPSLESAQALQNAPQRADSFFRVPAVLDPTGGGG